MTKELPIAPNLEHLKKQAKALLAGYRSADSHALKRVTEHHPQWVHASGPSTTPTQLSLADAQMVVAREYGFTSWAKLKKHVEDLPAPDIAARAMDDPRVAFIRAIRAKNPERLSEILGHHPELANMPFTGRAWSSLNDALPKALSELPGESTAIPALIMVSGIGGRVDLARVLIAHGADVNAIGYEDNKGMCTPIVTAAWMGDIETMRLLLENGADVSGEYGQAAVRTAAEHAQPDRLDLLAEYGAGVSVHDMVAAGMAERVLPMADQDARLMSEKNARGLTPLQAAVESMDIDNPVRVEPSRKIATELIRRGAEIDIFSAAGLGDLKRLKELLKHDPSQANDRLTDEATPLTFAAICGQAEAARMLLEAGADPEARVGEYRRSALEIAARRNHIEVCRVLLVHGATVTDGALCQACWSRNGNNESVVPLVEHGANVNASWGLPALHWLITSENEEMARYLIDHGANVNVREDQFGWTALHRAVMAGSLGTVRLLLERGADADIKDQFGKTPLDWATESGETEIAEALREASPNV